MFPPVHESRHRCLQWRLQEVLALQGGGGGQQGAWGENPKSPPQSYLSNAVAAIPVSPWLPLQHRDCALCKTGGRLLPSGGTARGWLQVNISCRFFSTHKTVEFVLRNTYYVCNWKYFAGASPPSSWVSTNLMPSLRAGPEILKLRLKTCRWA